jgi:hypothetical protein
MSSNLLHKVRRLLPGYVNKTLAADDQVFMDQWMRDESNQHPALLDEMRWLALSREQLREVTPAVAADAGWHQLLARIDAQPRRQSAPPGWLDKTRSRLRGWWATPVVGFAAAAVLTVQLGAIAWLSRSDDDAARPMSAPAATVAADAALLQVVFKDQASVAQVRAALAAAGATVVDGPGALGVWRVRVARNAAAAALTALRQQAAVEQAVLAP